MHARPATQAILETVKGHRAERQLDMFDLFGEREMPLHEKLLKSYEHADGWTNANRFDTAAGGGFGRGNINLHNATGLGGIPLIAHARVPPQCGPQACLAQAIRGRG